MLAASMGEMSTIRCPICVDSEDSVGRMKMMHPHHFNIDGSIRAAALEGNRGLGSEMRTWD